MALAALAAFLLAQDQIHDWIVAPLRGGYTIDSPAPLELEGSLTQEKPQDDEILTWTTSDERCILTAELISLGPSVTRPDQSLGAFVQGFLGGGEFTLEHERDLVWRGWAGLEIEYRSSQGVRAEARVYVINNTIFFANAVLLSPAGRSEADRFVGSMVIPARAGNGPFRKAGPDMQMFELPEIGTSLLFPFKPEKMEGFFGEDDERSKGFMYGASFCNRFYACISVEVPETVAGQIEDLQQALDELHTEGLARLKAKNRKDTYMKRDNTVMLDTTAELDGMLFHFRSFFRGLRLYLFMASTPRALRDWPEVRAFFDSPKFKDLPRAAPAGSIPPKAGAASRLPHKGR